MKLVWTPALVIALLLVALLIGAEPAVAITITVNQTGDQADFSGGSGACDVELLIPGSQCTLRAAIQTANANATADIINFNIGTGPKTITVGSALPVVSTPVTIDGTTQTVMFHLISVPCHTNQGHPCIEINGNNVNADGLVLSGGNSVVKGLIINRFQGSGIVISSGSNTVQYTYVGTDMAGTGDLGNGASFSTGGIKITGSGNTVGGTAASARNIISGNYAYGVIVTGAGATGNAISGNYIGSDKTGTVRLPNDHDGVRIEGGATANILGGTAGTTPGGACTGACNLLSGNGKEPNLTGASGVSISGGSTGNSILGNYIGINVSGTAELHNTISGVEINGSNNNTVGGTTAAARNVISGNANTGIVGGISTGETITGNYIGTNSTGTAAVPNLGSGIALGEVDDVTIGGTTGTSPGGSCTGACNLISGNAKDGIYIFAENSTMTGITIQGNYIGLNATGIGKIANGALSGPGKGITIVTDGLGGATGNVIGGTTPAARNVISGNEYSGVVLGGAGTTGNTVSGNYIGTLAVGSEAMGNAFDGVDVVDGAHDNTIGGTQGTSPGGSCTGACNLISGNDVGIEVSDGDTTGNTIAGNYIGTNPAGTAGIANQQGVVIYAASENTVGGTTPGARNVISGNMLDGVVITDEAAQSDANGNVVSGNYIGVTTGGDMGLGNGRYGVIILASNSTHQTLSNVVEDNVISGNTSDGVRIGADKAGAHADSNIVRRNIIGLNAAGDAAIPNAQTGVRLLGTDPAASVASNLIGGGGPGPVRSGLDADGNVISGNLGNGIEISGMLADDNSVYGNLIGTDATGTTPLGNGFFGVRVASGATGTTIGYPGAGNVIAGNSVGIRIGDPTTTGTTIQGNFIGTNPDGDDGLGNANEGIFTSNSPDSTIGGDAPGEANIIMHNGASGVRVLDSDAIHNRISANSIDDNGALGIELDNGGNEDQEAPVLSSAETGSTHAQGSLDSAPSTQYRVELFDSPACDDSGAGEGRTYLGSGNVTTNGAGHADLNITVPATATAGHVLTATATDPDGNTSQFSNCVTVTGSATPTPTPSATATPTPTPTGSVTPSPTGPTPTGPTPTGPTPTGGPTPTPTATPAPGKLTQGDVDCDGDVDSVDGLKELRHVAALSVSQEPGCPDIGAEVASLFGDVDCDNDIDAVDALKVLRHVAALSVSQSEPCPDIGSGK